VTKPNSIASQFPQIAQHQGVWIGEYIHTNLNGDIIDRNKSQVECLFPKDSHWVYVQKNHFSWTDGREKTSEFGAIIKDNKLFWDTESFKGYGWESEHCIILELERKDIPNASFTEIILMGEDHQSRVRTWHWFKNGRCFQRTLCNEFRTIDT